VDDVFWVSDYFGNFYDEAEMGLEALMMNDLLSAAVCLLSGMMWELLASGVHTDHIRRKFLQGIVDSRLVWRALLVGM